jgi:hypothetical protein
LLEGVLGSSASMQWDKRKYVTTARGWGGFLYSFYKTKSFFFSRSLQQSASHANECYLLMRNHKMIQRRVLAHRSPLE